ncbi:MAG: TIGR02270 family protein [Byssovorax sp.]
MTPRAAILLWDVIEEHLDEADFLFGQWERALSSPTISLDDLAAHGEERLLAHLDGLVAAGRPAADRLLRPALAGTEPDRATAAGLALLAGEGDGLDAVLDAAAKAPADRRAPLLRALALADRPEIDARLTSWLGEGDALLVAAALSTLTFRGGDPGRALGKIRADDAPALVRAGVIAARSARSRPLQQLAGEALGSPDTAVRDEAILTGLLLGFSAAWDTCRRLVGAGDPSSAGLLGLCAMAGGPAEREAVQRAIEVPELAIAALDALGQAGTVGAAEACLFYLDDARLGPTAASAFATITGLPLRAPYLAAPPRGEPGIPADEALAAEDRETSLPRLDPGAAHRFWGESRSRFDPRTRYLLGEPLRVDTALAALRHGPMRRRPSLALEIALRTRGKFTVETRAFTARQRAEIGKLRALPALAFERPLE